MPRKTEGETCIYLIGQVNKDIDGSDLPTNRKILSVFFYQHRRLNHSISKSAINAIEEAENVWRRLPESIGIPMNHTRNSVRKLEKLHSAWIKIHKNRFRTSSAQKLREEEYKKELDEVFDIGPRIKTTHGFDKNDDIPEDDITDGIIHFFHVFFRKEKKFSCNCVFGFLCKCVQNVQKHRNHKFRENIW